MISPSDITCIVVIENYNELANHTIESIKKFTNPMPKVLICFNSGNTKAINIKRYKSDKINFIEKCNKDKNIKIVMNNIPGNIKNTSIRHGMGINKMMELVDTKYTAIIESDVIITSDKWWHLDEKKYDIKAIPRGKKDIPYWHVCFLIFRTDIFKNIDWRAEKRSGHGDTGWQMYSKVLENNSEIKQMSVKNCHKSQDTKYFKDTLNKKSFEIISDGDTIAAHFGRGSDLARVNKFMHSIYQWARICKEILYTNEVPDNTLPPSTITIPKPVRKKPWKKNKIDYKHKKTQKK